MYQVMLFYIIINNLEHRCIFVGIDNIANIQFQRLFTVYCYAGRNELIYVISHFCEKVNCLTAINIDYFNHLPFISLYLHAAARIDDISLMEFSL